MHARNRVLCKAASACWTRPFWAQCENCSGHGPQLRRVPFWCVFCTIGGYGKQINRWIEATASVVSPHTFHVAWEELLKKLRRANTHTSQKAAEYSISNILYQESGLWKSTWQCAYGTCLPGFSTFASNCLEAHWNVLDILHGGKEDRETASKCFVQMERDARVWQHDQRLAQIHTRPTFSSPCLLRGDGLMTGKGSLYKKSFRRTTVAKLLRAQHQSPVAIEVDIKSPTCVPAKRIFSSCLKYHKQRQSRKKSCKWLKSSLPIRCQQR